MIRLAREWCCDLCGATAIVASTHPWPARNARHTPVPDHPPDGWWSSGLYGAHLCATCRDSDTVREYRRARQEWGERRRLAVAESEAERERVAAEWRAALDSAGPGPECPWSAEARARRSGGVS